MSLQTPLAFGLLALSCIVHGEVHMRILQEQKLLGYATISQRLSADGGKVVEMRMELLGQGSEKTQLHKTSTYDKVGHPIRMVLELVGHERTESIVTFTAEGAKLSKVVHGIAKDSTIRRADTAPWADPSEFWFLRDHPKTGVVIQTLLFSVDKADWDLTAIRYLGKRQITVQGHAVTANAVESTSGDRTSTAYLTDSGDPIVLDVGTGVRMETIAK